jgi:hypothetical protein
MSYYSILSLDGVTPDWNFETPISVREQVCFINKINLF